MKSAIGMRYIIYAIIFSILIILQILHDSQASPTVLVTRNLPNLQNSDIKWLPKDNQTIYKLKEGEVRRLELNTSMMISTPVFITVSPCNRDVQWALYHAETLENDANFKLIAEYKNGDTSTYLAYVKSKKDRYVLQLLSANGGSTAVSTRGESPKTVRLRLRTRSKRRLAANWDPSPIDPQATTYCIVASHRRNYTSLCAAQYDLKNARQENKSNWLDIVSTSNNVSHFEGLIDVENKIDKEAFDNNTLNWYKSDFKNYYRKNKFSRSTKVTDEDPMVSCVGDRTSHMIENLDSAKNYYVSIFGVGRDRWAGTLLATSSIQPRSSTARRLRENVATKSELRGGKLVFYYKTAVTSSGGLWLSISTCGGTVDIEVLARGKRLQVFKNINQHSKLFVPAPMVLTTVQDKSDENSMQFESSSSEELKLRYVIKVTPALKDFRDNVIAVELTASSRRWGVNMPELAPHDGAIVRELRPKRSCHSLDIAFLPAKHETANIIRYCISIHETTSNFASFCTTTTKRASMKTQCIVHKQKSSEKVIIHKISGLRADRKYAIQVTASTKGTVPYNTLFADTNVNCYK